MGAMPKPDAVELPISISYLYDAYRQVKFSRILNANYDIDDAQSPKFLLIARTVLNYIELEAYSRVSEMNLQHWEIETMLSIDGIFEHSRGG